VTPAELARRLREYQAKVATLAPERVEQVLRSEAAARADGQVSAVVTRTTTGAHLALSGPGSRAQSREIARTLSRTAAEAVFGVVR
jgi:hypothetical protein